MPRHFQHCAMLVLLACTLAGSASAGEILVTNTNDAGAGSLRAAISAAVSGNEIRFAIGETGVQTINPATALPPIAAGVTINGISQPGASCETWPPTLRIEIAGDAAPGGIDGLRIGGNDVLVRGLAINSFSGDAIHVANASGVHIECNFIGTDATGALDYGNAGVGVRLVGSTLAVIGGGAVSQRNLISANAVAGVLIDDTSSANSVMGNYIGTDAAGATRLDNFNGVIVRGATNAIADNRISGNTESGVLLDAAAATGNSIRGNSMTGNGALGIDLGPVFFATPNDPGDPDSGPNRLQNTPVLVDVAYAAGLDQVTATFAVSTDPANASYPLLVDFYGADVDDEEGESYLGTLSYEASDFAVGDVTKTFTPVGAVQAGDGVVATATDANGNTSEFTADAIAVVVPEPAALACCLVALAALAARRRTGTFIAQVAPFAPGTFIASVASRNVPNANGAMNVPNATMRGSQRSEGRAPISTDAT